MKTNNLIKIILLVGAVLFLAGCAGMTGPVIPGDMIPGEVIPGEVDVAGGNEGMASSGHVLWGWADGIFDVNKGEVEIVPDRTTQIHLNVLGPVMSGLGMQIDIDTDASDIPNGLVVLDVSLTHPFAGAEKFSGFDVKGILITPGTFDVPPIIAAGLDETWLLNADGLTRWWNPSEFTGTNFLLGYIPGKPGDQNSGELTATANPYKVFADALGAESPLGDLILPQLDDPDGRAVFTAGTTNTRRYEIQFPVSGGPIFKFNYAIDASWMPPSPNPPGEVPDDFPMSANQPEAFRIQIVFPNNTLEYLEGGAVTGELRVQAIVSDWQGMESGNIQSEIENVIVYAPTLLSGPVTLDYVTESFDHATYEAEVTSYVLPLSSADPHLLFVSAEAAASDGTYTQAGTTVGPDENIAAWNSAIVEINSVTCDADGNDDYTTAVPIELGGDAFGTLCNPGGDPIDAEDWYTFDVPASTIASGSIRLETQDVPTGVELYDGTQTKIGEAIITGGIAEITEPSELTEGPYYIRIFTTNENEIVNYDIFNMYINDPCADDIQFLWEVKIDEPDLNIVSIGRKSVVVDGQDVWVVYTEGSGYARTVMCRHSGDGSLSWDAPVQVNLIEIAALRFWPTITRDNTGRLYCAWTDWSNGAPEPFVNSSIDGGQTWSEEVSIYDFETAPLQINNEALGVIIDTDDSGRVHATWLDRRIPAEYHLYYTYSDTQGVSWEPAELVDDSPVELQAASTMYDFDVSASGNVACVWTDRRGLTYSPLTGLDVYCNTRDEVTPFGTGVMINPEDLDFEQTSPGVGISLDGIIHVSWVDRRNDEMYGGPNPANTWELFYARSEDGGATFTSEAEIPAPGAYTELTALAPRVIASPWGSVYVLYQWGLDTLQVSRSCDGGDAWEPAVTAFTLVPTTYFMETHSMAMGPGGQVYELHADTRVEPGGDYEHWNCFMNVGE